MRAEVEPSWLPDAVRQQVVALAADRIGAMPAAAVPAGLRAFMRFAPAKRAKLAAAPLAAAVDSDPEFRSELAGHLRAALPELAAAIDSGSVPPAAPPEDVATMVYLLRPDRWQQLLAAAAGQLDAAADRAAAAAADGRSERLQEQLDALRSTSRAELERVRDDLAAQRTENADLRRRLREAAEGLRAAERAASEARGQAAADGASAAAAFAAAEAEIRRLKTRLAAAEEAGEAARRAARTGRSSEELRLRLLLDTLVEAAGGLRRELALPPATGARPADAVADPVAPGTSAPSAPARGLATDDPELIDQLMTLPQVHLIVDGYNVTKSGYGTLPLESQRGRLLAGLAGLGARTGAEVSCVFDGAERRAPLAGSAPRNVRVLFSKPEETADDVIRRLVRAEPHGRPVVVVSSDREVAESVRRSGAYAVASAALLRRLSRG